MRWLSIKTCDSFAERKWQLKSRIIKFTHTDENLTSNDKLIEPLFRVISTAEQHSSSIFASNSIKIVTVVDRNWRVLEFHESVWSQ